MLCLLDFAVSSDAADVRKCKCFSLPAWYNAALIGDYTAASSWRDCADCVEVFVSKFSSKFSSCGFFMLALCCVTFPKPTLAADCPVPDPFEGAAELAYYACIDGAGGSDGSGGGSGDGGGSGGGDGGSSGGGEEVDPGPIVVTPPPAPKSDPVFAPGSPASRLAENARVKLSQTDGDAVNEAVPRLERLSAALAAPLSEASVVELREAEKSFAEAVSATIRALKHSDRNALYEEYASEVLEDKDRESAEDLLYEISFLRKAVELYPFDDALFAALENAIIEVRTGNPWNATIDRIAGGELDLGAIAPGSAAYITVFNYATNLLLERELVLATRARKNARSFQSITINGEVYKADGTVLNIYHYDPSKYVESPVLTQAIDEQRALSQQRAGLDHIRKTVKAFTEGNPQVVFIDAQESMVEGKVELTIEYTMEPSALDEVLQMVAELAEADEKLEFQSVVDLGSRGDAFPLNDDLSRDADGQSRQEKTASELAYAKLTFSRRLAGAPESGDSELRVGTRPPTMDHRASQTSVATLVDRLVDSVVDNTLFEHAPINPNDLDASKEILSLEVASTATVGTSGFSVVRSAITPPSGLSSAAGLNLGSVLITDSAEAERRIGGVSINETPVGSGASARTEVVLADWLRGGDEASAAPLVSAKSGARSAAALTQASTRRFIPLMTGELYALSPNFPNGLLTLADGTMLAVKSGLGGRLVVAPLDLKLLEDGFASMGEVVYNAPQAQIRVIKDGQIVLSAAPSLNGVRARTGDASDGVWTFPSDGDESSLDYTLELQHPAGIVETLQPAILDKALIRSVNSIDGLALSVDRATGVINVSGLRFRPSYTTSALTSGETTYLARLGDEQGVAYFLGDRNGDGIEDVTVYSALGKQVLYGLSGP